MNVELHLKIVGAALILLSLAHVVFPRYFRWGVELAKLSVVNRQIMKVHTLFIALAVLLMGVLCLGSAADLVATPLGRRVALGLAIFWVVRLLVQFFGYSKELWHGKPFETAVHVLFACLFCYFTVILALVAFGT